MPEYDLSNLKVLVIDQHPGMRHLLRDVLRELGVVSIRMSGTPEEAFEAFREFDPDLILTDWAPGLDGLRFLDMVRRSEGSPNAFAPVVMVSAYTELHHICRARDAGINEYLAKPFTATKLYKRIKAIVENPRLYIRNGNYFGPDRRRRRVPWSGAERRRQEPNRQGTPAPRREAAPLPGSAATGR